VIIRPKQRFDRVALFRAFGKFIADMHGHYITAEDSGTGLEDMGSSAGRRSSSPGSIRLTGLG